jgi:hypothetical protein
LVETACDPAFIKENREKLVRLYPLRRLGLPDGVAPRWRAGRIDLRVAAPRRLDGDRHTD